MRAHEFITESVTNGLNVAAYALPDTYVIPELQNQDFYRQYRFGVAIAAVRSEEGNDTVYQTDKPKFKKESDWGENQIVTSYDPNIERVIDKALAKIGIKNKKIASSKHSQEMFDIHKGSPLKAFKGYPK